MSENVQIIPITGSDSVDSIINKLKKSDPESYGVIFYPGKMFKPTLFQGYSSFWTEDVLYDLKDGVWESSIPIKLSDFKFDDDCLMRLSQNYNNYHGSYEENTGALCLIKDTLLLIGPKDPIEASYYRQCRVVKENRILQNLS